MQFVTDIVVGFVIFVWVVSLSCMFGGSSLTIEKNWIDVILINIDINFIRQINVYL